MTVRRRWDSDASSTDVQAHDLKFRRVHGTAFPGQHLPLKGMWIGPAGAPREAHQPRCRRLGVYRRTRFVSPRCPPGPHLQAFNPLRVTVTVEMAAADRHELLRNAVAFLSDPKVSFCIARRVNELTVYYRLRRHRSPNASNS